MATGRSLLGETATGKKYDLAFDEVVVSTASVQ